MSTTQGRSKSTSDNGYWEFEVGAQWRNQKHWIWTKDIKKRVFKWHWFKLTREEKESNMILRLWVQVTKGMVLL